MRLHLTVGATRQSTRGRNATIAAFVVLAAMVPAGAVVAADQTVDASLPYSCTLPSGAVDATVRVSASLPDRVEVGQAIQAADVETSVELSEEAVHKLTAKESTTVTAGTRLAVDVAQGDSTAQALWRGSANPQPVPATGPLTLKTTGAVPTVTGQDDGDLTFTAGALGVDLALTAATPDTDPQSTTLECTPAKDATALLATVTVGTGTGTGTGAPDGSPTASPSASPSGTPGEEDETTSGSQDKRAPKVAGRPSVQADARPAAPPCKYDAGYPIGPMSLNSYVAGYANVRKQNAAALIPPFCTLLEQGAPEFEPYPDWSGGVIRQHSTGDLYNNGRKESTPFTATLLTFRFMPAKATMVLEQAGPLTADSLGATDFVFTSTDTYIRVPLVLRVTKLEVDGTPLNVGPTCRTSGPLKSPEPDSAKFPGDHLVLHGRGEQVSGEPATGYQLLSGGPLTGEVTIPAFHGCDNAGENLDRLFTAAVSGSGNYIKQMQGQTCYAAAEVPNPDECTEDRQPLKVPVPER
ncbi:DUF6801 domain-containing protein [Streptomyces sp. NPDC006173]|uniref:DUF6801 domain-containing protein n=1 Tax=Streptomyces sp. NPDC006173 TaxID=3155349 RepID=UPI0033E54DDA